jgi:hypothetical protein
MAFVFRQLASMAAWAGGWLACTRQLVGVPPVYILLSWLGATPETYMGDSARLSAAMADAPTDAGVEPQIWDASRIRTFEQTLLQSGRQIYSVAADTTTPAASPR